LKNVLARVTPGYCKWQPRLGCPRTPNHWISASGIYASWKPHSRIPATWCVYKLTVTEYIFVGCCFPFSLQRVGIRPVSLVAIATF